MTPPLPPPLTLSKIWYLQFLSIYASKIARKPLYVAMLRRHVATNITTGDQISAISVEKWPRYGVPDWPALQVYISFKGTQKCNFYWGTRLPVRVRGTLRVLRLRRLMSCRRRRRWPYLREYRADQRWPGRNSNACTQKGKVMYKK